VGGKGGKQDGRKEEGEGGREGSGIEGGARRKWSRVGDRGDRGKVGDKKGREGTSEGRGGP
jgi:hypothetical protein